MIAGFRLLLVAAFLPLPALAQIKLFTTQQFKYAPGVYRLEDGEEGSGTLKYELAGAFAPSCLRVKDDGVHQLAKYPLSYVRSFAIEGRSFVRVEVDDLPATGGFDQKYSDPIFLEVADTGRVNLYAYHYNYQTLNEITAVSMPVLRVRGSQTYVFFCPERVPGFSRKVGLPKEAAPLFSNDPELQRRILSGAVTWDNLAAYVRAYNRGEQQPR
jgi:hypothetical protein